MAFPASNHGHIQTAREQTGQRFVRNSALLLFAELASKALGLAFFIVLARFLGVRDLGVYAYAFTIANFFVIAPRFGFERLAQKEIGRTNVLERNYLIEISAVKGILAVCMLALLWLGLFFLKSRDIFVIIVVALFVFQYSYMEFLNSLFRGLKRSEYEVIVRLFFALANVISCTVLLYRGFGLPAVACTQLVCISCTVVLEILLLRRFMVRRPFHWSLDALWKNTAAGAPFAGILVALYFSNQSGILILSGFKGETEVGYFAAAMRIFDNLTLIAAAVMGAFLPTMSELHITSKAAFSRTLEFTMKYLFTIAAPIAVGLIVLAEGITKLLYGDSFLPSAAALRILGAAMIFNFWNYVADSVLIAVDRERLLFRLTCLGAGIHIGANLILTPLFSYRGACWATVATQFIYFMALFVYVREYIAAGVLFRSVARPALCAAGMGWAVYMVRERNVFLAVALGAAVYFAGLLLSRSVGLGEMKRLQETIRR